LRRKYTSHAKELEHHRILMERLELVARRKIAVEERRATRQAMADYAARREAEAIDLTNDVQIRMQALSALLKEGLKHDPRIDFSALKVTANLPRFSASRFASPGTPPSLDEFLPQPLSLWSRLLPPLVTRHELKVKAARDEYDVATALYEREEQQRLSALGKLQASHKQACADAERVAAEKNAEVDAFAEAFRSHERDAVIDYFELVLEKSRLPDGFPLELRITYVVESKQLVIERELPTIDIIPDHNGFRYIKKADRIEPIKRKPADIRSIYADLLAQLTLRTLWEVANADTDDAVSVIAFNGYVDTVDPATGNRVKPTLISVSATKSSLEAIALEHVEPIACLKSLKALVSRSAHELEPVRPIVNFDMADRRFIDKSDVLSELDSRPNLADLSPGEFESLMTNLFEKMGLETRLTQASRDGGVDCVAWDMRPVIGGKVIVQAKRYRNTVGVSAVRDLYGTMMNEGAAKGILVTTSGYGQSAYDFAKNKPIELITGSNLLSMLSEYAEIEAKIVFPDEWKDPMLT
jgi:restriction system protein